ncbi:MAG: nuclear transport factor 2 family protein [Candidatus Heimdallarchaeota archaeon]
MNCYFDGAINQDYKQIFKIWHPDAKIMSLNKDKSLKIYDREIWKEWYEKAVKDPDVKRTAEILNINNYGIAANAKVKIIIESPKEKIIYVDYLNFLKIEEKWQITNKIFNTEHYPKE